MNGIAYQDEVLSFTHYFTWQAKGTMFCQILTEPIFLLSRTINDVFHHLVTTLVDEARFCRFR